MSVLKVLLLLLMSWVVYYKCVFAVLPFPSVLLATQVTKTIMLCGGKNTHFVHQMESGLTDWRLTGVMLLHFPHLL